MININQMALIEFAALNVCISHVSILSISALNWSSIEIGRSSHWKWWISIDILNKSTQSQCKISRIPSIIFHINTLNYLIEPSCSKMIFEVHKVCMKSFAHLLPIKVYLRTGWNSLLWSTKLDFILFFVSCYSNRSMCFYSDFV